MSVRQPATRTSRALAGTHQFHSSAVRDPNDLVDLGLWEQLREIVSRAPVESAARVILSEPRPTVAELAARAPTYLRLLEA